MEAEADLPELPNEIICSQILPSLPAKSLMRFKCVCKSWFSLTRNPSFLRVHRNLRCNSSNMYTHLLLHFYDETALHERLLSLQINQDGSPSLLTHCLTLPYEYRLYQTYSSNGLVLLKLGNALIYDHPIRIFNPCTRESITLPLPNFPTHISYPWFQIVHLFGFSPLTNEYKVLQVQYRISLGESARTIHGFTFKIFTLGTHEWRNIEVDHLPFHPHTWDFLKKSVCVNGSLHWLTLNRL
ncbi:putative F-box protein [Rosa sericea]